MMNTVMEPSAYGFKNIKPRTRRERHAMGDKTATEKLRLEQRVGHEARMHRANAPETSAGLTSCIEDGAGYINNADRFHTDTAGEQYEARQAAIIQKQKKIELHRIQAQQREEERLKYEAIKVKRDQERVNYLQTQSKAALRNQSGTAYDMINLQYQQGSAGEKQKYEDDLIKYRAEMRTRNLVQKAGSRASYNIISGDDRDTLPIPSRIQPSDTSSLIRSKSITSTYSTLYNNNTNSSSTYQR